LDDSVAGRKVQCDKCGTKFFPSPDDEGFLILFDCPGCEREFQLPGSRAGARFQCESCGVAIKVPTLRGGRGRGRSMLRTEVLHTGPAPSPAAVSTDRLLCECPECSAEHEVGADMQGKTMSCADCGSSFRVPQLPDGNTTADAASMAQELALLIGKTDAYPAVKKLLQHALDELKHAL